MMGLVTKFLTLTFMILLVALQAKASNELMGVGTSYEALIKRFEGLSLKVYNDQHYLVKRAKNGKIIVPTKGYLHIGYGHKFTKDELETGIITIGNQVVEYADGITEKQALLLLKKDTVIVEKIIRKHIKVELNQHEFDATASYIYNCGYLALFHRRNGRIMFNNPRNFLKYLNQGKKDLAGLYINFIGRFEFLQKRRNVEKKVFRGE